MDKHSRQPGGGKLERYIQPSILLALRRKPSYGYELIQEIARYGFIEGQTPPGMVYRHLRQIEEDGLVTSEWDTGEAGPAKRVYSLTAEGEGLLASWVDYMEKQAQNLFRFVQEYREQTGQGGADRSA